MKQAAVFFLLLFSFPVFSASNYDRMEYVKVLEREDKSLSIKKYVLIKNSDEKIYEDSYWKVYYQKDKIIGEELYEKGRLVYYYIYYYKKDKIYQKGFFWHGVYYDIKYFKAQEKYIKQGFFYKNYPETYKVYNSSGKLIYSYYYQDFES
ncbi:MAG TPA: hypothetical protein DHW82_12320 [Spirochaetia bacterium]|nr:hypothetical protein [Spirochaetia bacterium]